MKFVDLILIKWQSFPLLFCDATEISNMAACGHSSELNVDNWNDNCEAKSPRPLRGLQVDFSLLRGQII